MKVSIKRKNLKYLIVGILILSGGLLFFSKSGITGFHSASPYDGFAQCVSEAGATFYGAWWCPHCDQQKELFGNAMQYVDYIECSTDDRQLTPPCIEAGIESIPTWIFADGSRSGGLPLEGLAQKTGCSLPQ